MSSARGGVKHIALVRDNGVGAYQGISRQYQHARLRWRRIALAARLGIARRCV